MDRQEIERRVEDIRQKGVLEGDDEDAHGMEDNLREDFIRGLAEKTIVGDDEEIRRLAGLVLSTQEFDFSRVVRVSDACRMPGRHRADPGRGGE